MGDYVNPKARKFEMIHEIPSAVISPLPLASSAANC